MHREPKSGSPNELLCGRRFHCPPFTSWEQATYTEPNNRFISARTAKGHAAVTFSVRSAPTGSWRAGSRCCVPFGAMHGQSCHSPDWRDKGRRDGNARKEGVCALWSFLPSSLIGYLSSDIFLEISKFIVHRFFLSPQSRCRWWTVGVSPGLKPRPLTATGD